MRHHVLRFIEVFRESANKDFFLNCACYWFAVILHERFPQSTIMYNPETVHFATKIDDDIYDISGMILPYGYEEWEEYEEYADDTSLIIENCIYLKE